MKPAKIILGGRREGKTHKLVAYAKKHKRIVLCFSKNEAERIKKMYDVDTRYHEPRTLLGLNRPVVIDNWLLHKHPYEIINHAISHNQIEKLRTIVTMDNTIFDIEYTDTWNPNKSD